MQRQDYRRPSAEFEGRNGFFEASPLPEGGRFQFSNEALNRHRRALYILTQKDRPIPSLDDMKEALAAPEDSTSVEKEIKELRKQHLEDLQRLYTFHAEEYLDDAVDRYLAKDETQYLAPTENNPAAKGSYARLDALYANSRRYTAYSSVWSDDIERHRHAYLRRLVHLQAKHKELQTREEETRKRREAQFPLTIEEFHSKSHDVKHRVARFLRLTDPAKQEKMMSEFGWAYRQVKPLQDEVNTNEAFKAELQAFLIQHDVTDPRRRLK